ncbi:hypothetical protein [Streptomyces sp. NPDC057877]|uniref:hypothetical protein n=1 Tax=Streptomyces sp. NPDC057877 TaxID=3346269 RepID=UPI0036C4D57E
MYGDPGVLLSGAGTVHPVRSSGPAPRPARAAGAAPCLRLARGADPGVDLAADRGPYRPWAEALTDPESLDALPEPPPDLMYVHGAALRCDDRPAPRRVHARLRPATGELVGAGSGLVALGPVDEWLARIGRALGGP